MLVLSNDDVEELLGVADAMEALEGAYRALAADEAINTPRIDSLMPGPQPASVYSFKQMGGGLIGRVQALRINSDIIHWPQVEGVARRVKVPAAAGRYVGLVYLYDATTGMPLLICPDGVMQHIRVAAANGIAARLLAPPGGPPVALLGTGWQAETQLEAALIATGARAVRVFSPNRAHREEFCRRLAARFPDVRLQAAESAEACVQDAGVIAAATNSMAPVLRPEWIAPGRHFSTIKTQEVGRDFIGRTRPFLHTSRQAKATVTSIGPVPGDETAQGWWQDAEVAQWPDLADLLSGRAKGRRTAQDVTLFVNNVGMGLQFAAVGEVVLERARARGLGHSLPDDWFLESVHP